MGAVSRAWKRVDYTELSLQFRPRGSKDVLDAVVAAALIAYQVVQDAGWGDDVHTGALPQTPGRWCYFAGPGMRNWLGASLCEVS